MTSSADVVVTALARTPFGRFNGALRGRTGPELGAAMIDEVCGRAGLAAGAVDAV
jgi:acetyl-CoA C-acetyltransferase